MDDQGKLQNKYALPTFPSEKLNPTPEQVFLFLNVHVTSPRRKNVGKYQATNLKCIMHTHIHVYNI